MAEAKLADKSPLLAPCANTAIRVSFSLLEATRSIWQAQTLAVLASNKDFFSFKAAVNAGGKITFEGFPEPAKTGAEKIMAMARMVIKGFMVRCYQVYKRVTVFVGTIELDINRICGQNAKNLQMQVFQRMM
jgi:hypothetical protein